MRCGAWPFACAAAIALSVPGALRADELVYARLTDPTTRYEHGVFGHQTSFGTLELTVNTCMNCAGFIFRDLLFTLPAGRVFEDNEARVGDLDGDRAPEVMVVETDIALGAALAVYDLNGKRAATAFIGQPRRWLAPAGTGDFDGDGRIEIAYVDRPHLAKELVFLRYEAGALSEIVRAPDLTNHRFGEAEIWGGTRSCGGRDALILASADWTRTLQVTLEGGELQIVDLGPMSDQAEAMAMACPY